MRPSIPDTRNSLILRLPDKQDVVAWDQFVSIYEPLVYRLARAKGFRDADAREIVQEVLVAVSQAVERWEPDPQRGRFRDWLFRIARNLMIKFLTRRKYRALGTGDPQIAELLEQQVDMACDDSAEFDLEYRREVFRWAAEQVREQVKERTWQAFWMTSVDGHETADVARKLEMSDGAVHIARSRVRGRLRQAIETFEQDDAYQVPSQRVTRGQDRDE
ncbi:MAG: sigma-70 family RNA polymerase sigma factor [Fuerstiella sp.]